MSQSHKSSQMKDDAGNAALIPGSSAWGALKGGTSQKPLILSSDGGTQSGEKTSPKPASGDKSWPPPSSSCSMLHINGIVNRWGGGNASGANNGAWADNKDVGCGWGSPDSSPVPNAGTEVWSAQKQSADGASTCWGSDGSTPGSVWGGGDTKNSAETDSKSLWPKTCSQPSVWGAASDAKSPSSDHWGSRDSTWGSPSPQATAVITPSSTLSTWAQAAGRGLPAVAASKSGSNSAPGSLNISREELIVRAINSQDGWGQTPIRQDTAWDVTTAEPSVTGATALCKLAPQTELTVQPPANNTGTAIWEASKDSAAELGPRALLTSAGQESVLPWVGADPSVVSAGWEMPPLPVDGSALLSGERSLPPSVKCGPDGSSAWSTLLDSKDASVPAVSPWSGGKAGCGDAGLNSQSVSVDGGAAAAVQCNALAALLDRYKQQSALWDQHCVAVHSDPAAVSSGQAWVGPQAALIGSDHQRGDIWSQQPGAVSKPAPWASTEPSDGAIWNSAALVSCTLTTFVLSFLYFLWLFCSAVMI